ncbi:FAD-binding oxidoreductase [Tateyamaria omphalii]|uniref:FAD-binding oxidoreductase n=1 Tax=Tateyamaria omphalii TaxID=299262 RepID=UPI001C996573|nr:FAD-binding oxidoreductase [Tateyamaria omphalii]MBY5931885.1 FAD-binding oxidoreductase [Tateyamaria omphalii]
MLNSLTEERAQAFLSRLPKDRFAKADAAHLHEPRGRYAGQAGLLALPRNTDEVATLVRAAADMRVPVIPYGGGTGLVGGQVAEAGPIPLILSLEKMTSISAVYPEENVLIADAGVILADVQAAAEQANRLFPLSLAAEGSARIGGNLSTNAGGTGVLRYGNARDLCLGVEAVLPSGEVFQGLSRLRKDNTGYDLRHLLIGAEGTLGVITAAALKLFPRPSATGTALMQVTSPSAALSLLALVRDHVGDGVSAFELIGAQGFAFLAETMPQVRNPWTNTPDWCVLIELGLTGAQDPAAALEGLFAAATEAGLVQDGMIAQNAQQSADFWSIRENIPEANRRIGSVSSHDISVPLGALADFIAEGGKRIAAVGDFRINCFGHVGDGNLHYNVFPTPGKSRADHEAQRPEIKRVVHDLVHEMGGSVSAEHGVGRLKVDDLERYADPTKLVAMRAIKTALDPHGIMNPGAVLRLPGG